MAALLYYIYKLSRCTCSSGNNCLYRENGNHVYTAAWNPSCPVGIANRGEDFRENTVHGYCGTRELVSSVSATVTNNVHPTHLQEAKTRAGAPSCAKSAAENSDGAAAASGPWGSL